MKLKYLLADREASIHAKDQIPNTTLAYEWGYLAGFEKARDLMLQYFHDMNEEGTDYEEFTERLGEEEV